MPYRSRVVLEQLTVQRIQGSLLNGAALVRALSMIVKKLLALSVRETAILIADPQEHLVAGVCIHGLSRTDLDDEKLIVLAILAPASKELKLSRNRGLAGSVT
jgi:hypothetical protein